MWIEWIKSKKRLIGQIVNMDNKRQTGKNYEVLAISFLEAKGYFIIEKNFQVRQAEIDLIARDGDTIVFVEVKYRSSVSSGHPLEAVTISKQRKICKAALFYMNKNKISPDNTSIRFDVIGILGDEITHIENAFDFVL